MGNRVPPNRHDVSVLCHQTWLGPEQSHQTQLSSGCNPPLAGLMISSGISYYPLYIGDYNNPIVNKPTNNWVPLLDSPIG